jgi:serine protease Do
MISRIVTFFAVFLALIAPVFARADIVPESRQQIQMSFAPLVKRTSPAVVNIYAQRKVQAQVNPFMADPFFAQFFRMRGMGGMTQERIEKSLGSGVIVSADGARSNVQGAGEYSFFIQTDAAINPGNSGGALVDMQGKLLGINSMIYSKDGGSLGIGFAIPSSMLRTVIEASHNGGKIVRAWTGLAGQAVTPEMVDSLGLDRATGALINRVNTNGPAYKAGIRTGDVVLSVNGHDVGDADALKFRLATVPIGQPIKLTLWRNGKTGEATLVAEAPPENPPRDETTLKGQNPFTGATVANISPAVSEELGGIPQESGVVVMKAGEGYAAQLGVQEGDILLAVNGKKINSVDQLRDLLDNATSRRWMMQVMRGSQVMNLAITI